MRYEEVVLIRGAPTRPGSFFVLGEGAPGGLFEVCLHLQVGVTWIALRTLLPRNAMFLAAKYENGVLTLTVTRSAAKTGKRLTVQ